MPSLPKIDMSFEKVALELPALVTQPSRIENMAYSCPPEKVISRLMSITVAGDKDIEFAINVQWVETRVWRCIMRVSSLA